MALYHLSAKMVSRGKGHSVVAGAAYRAGEKLRDDRTGKIHDYSSREDVAYSEILAPSVAPEWAKDRQAHWNQVDAVEKRKDSQLAREVEVGLQRELTLDQNRELLRAFVQEQFVDRGMVADMSIHWNDNNPHAHILLTTREIDGDGFGKKNRDWNKKELLQEWRQSWVEHNNHWLKENDSDARISHQTLAKQGIDREPTKHVGREAWYAHDKELDLDFARTREILGSLKSRWNSMRVRVLLGSKGPLTPLRPFKPASRLQTVFSTSLFPTDFG